MTFLNPRVRGANAASSLTVNTNTEPNHETNNTFFAFDCSMNRIEKMYPFQLGFYPDGYSRPMVFAEMFYPTAIVPVSPHALPIYRRLFSDSEQNSPTDLSTNAHKGKSDTSRCEEKRSENGSDVKCPTNGKRLNFGIDNILDKTKDEEQTPNTSERHKVKSKNSLRSDEPKTVTLPVVTADTLTPGAGEDHLHTSAYPYAFSHLRAAGPFSFPPPRYTSRSDYQGFQLLASQEQRMGNHQATPKRKRSWSRAVFSALQRKGLEKRFEIQKYVTKPDRRQLAAMLGLTDAQVKVWFQNRRMKWRHVEEQKKKRQQEEERRKRIMVQNKDASADSVSTEYNECNSTDFRDERLGRDNAEINEEINVEECMETETDGNLSSSSAKCTVLC